MGCNYFNEIFSQEQLDKVREERQRACDLAKQWLPNEDCSQVKEVWYDTITSRPTIVYMNGLKREL